MDLNQIREEILSKDKKITVDTNLTMDEHVEILVRHFNHLQQIQQRKGRPFVGVTVDLNNKHSQVWFEWMILDQWDAFTITVGVNPGDGYILSRVTKERMVMTEYKCHRAFFFIRKGLTEEEIKSLFRVEPSVTM